MMSTIRVYYRLKRNSLFHKEKEKQLRKSMKELIMPMFDKTVLSRSISIVSLTENIYAVEMKNVVGEQSKRVPVETIIMWNEKTMTKIDKSIFYTLSV